VTVHRIAADRTIEGAINAARRTRTETFSSRSVGAGGLAEQTDSFREMAAIFGAEHLLEEADAAAAAAAAQASKKRK
jgi:hypothetical protein